MIHYLGLLCGHKIEPRNFWYSSTWNKYLVILLINISKSFDAQLSLIMVSDCSYL